jgi:hypothetical protein
MRDSLDGTVINVTTKFRNCLAAALIAACGPQPSTTTLPEQLPPPCVGNDTIYFATWDSTDGLRVAQATDVYPPPSEFHGTAVVRILVTALGRANLDSSQITGKGTVRGVEDLRRSLVGYRFFPATLNGCAVRSWYSITVKR